MNKIVQLFSDKKNILSVYYTAGFPLLNDTTRILGELNSSGVDLIEIGIPFSDPLADGLVIQQSSQEALKNGMTLNLLFEQLADFNLSQNSSPIVLMGYFNPILQYGVENFCKSAKQVGVSAVIIPDLPLEVYVNEYKHLFEKHELENIFLITPQSTDYRIRLIDSITNSFIYVVSSASITGLRNSIDDSQQQYFERIKRMNLKNPCLIGFGIHDKISFRKCCEYSSGAIIGSAFINAIKNNVTTNDFINSIR